MLERRLDADDETSGSCTEGFKTSGVLEDECAARHSLYDV